MADEIQIIYNSGQTLYALLVKANTAWNGTSLETLNLAHWGNYAISTTETNIPGLYYASVPTSLPSGKFITLMYKQSGGSPVHTDTNISNADLIWNGTDEIDLSDIPISPENVNVVVSVADVSITTGVS